MTRHVYNEPFDGLQIDLTTFESILLIDNVEATDYGKYECEAQNEEGTSKSTIVLNVTSAPDVPLSLSVLNVTHDSVTISWVPGFDGGLRTSYRIRYRPEHTSEYPEHPDWCRTFSKTSKHVTHIVLFIRSDSEKEGYRYLDVMTENATSFTVTGLDLDTEYVFTLMAFNERGSSNYMHDVVRTRTSSKTFTNLGDGLKKLCPTLNSERLSNRIMYLTYITF